MPTSVGMLNPQNSIPKVQKAAFPNLGKRRLFCIQMKDRKSNVTEPA
jgi:hypothetical protein